MSEFSFSQLRSFNRATDILGVGGPLVRGKNLEDMTASNDCYGFPPVENIINFKKNG